MATSDLLAELSKDTFKPDSDGERRMCKCLLKLINDQSSDVQGLAVKCLSPLVRKVHEEHVDGIMAELTNAAVEERIIERVAHRIGALARPNVDAARLEGQRGRVARRDVAKPPQPRERGAGVARTEGLPQRGVERRGACERR